MSAVLYSGMTWSKMWGGGEGSRSNSFAMCFRSKVNSTSGFHFRFRGRHMSFGCRPPRHARAMSAADSGAVFSSVLVTTANCKQQANRTYYIFTTIFVVVPNNSGTNLNNIVTPVACTNIRPRPTGAFIYRACCARPTMRVAKIWKRGLGTSTEFARFGSQQSAGQRSPYGRRA